uniref:Aromatic-L-amino-acid decarboxylase n=1 Tax=Setaria digitata TaxID=48799 RepID=A0A915Q6F7_9BILA
MNANEFRHYGRLIIDLVTNYWESLRKRTPLPNVKPGFIHKLVPQDPPITSEPWEEIFNDIDKVVVDCNTHWHHPSFFAYLPTGCSYQAIMGDILSGGLASVGFSWKSSPSMTELEISMTNWLAKSLGLPSEFLNTDGGSAVGIIQSTASEATFVAILAARGRAVERIKGSEGCMEQEQQNVSDEGRSPGELCHYPYHDPATVAKLVAYCSDQAHSSVEKGAMLAAVRLRKLKTIRGGQFDNFYVTGKILEEAITIDRRNGLVPFIFIMTLGTTSTCGVDPIDELGPICQREKIWIHVDAAYAGAFLICPEYRYLTRGFEYIDSFNMNAHKALLINFDCSPMWFRNGKEISKYFEVNPIYLKHDQTCATDYRMTELAKYFEVLIQKDSLFELFVPRTWGLVCFRLKDSTNEMNEELNRRINEDQRIHVVASAVHGVYFLRIVVCSTLTTHEDIKQAHAIIHNFAADVRKDLKQ